MKRYLVFLLSLTLSCSIFASCETPVSLAQEETDEAVKVFNKAVDRLNNILETDSVERACAKAWHSYYDFGSAKGEFYEASTYWNFVYSKFSCKEMEESARANEQISLRNRKKMEEGQKLLAKQINELCGDYMPTNDEIYRE